jgi:hypothetical protein
MMDGALQRAILFVAGIVVGLLLLFVATHAPAKNYQQVICDNEPNPEECQKIHFWYLGARSNERTSCCGPADAYWADAVNRVTMQGLFLTITDRRDCEYQQIKPQIEEDGEGNQITVYDGQPCITGRVLRDGQTVFVPSEVLDRLKQGNPTHHQVVFISANSNRNYLDDGVMYPSVICAFPDFGG